jgi:hypothetical protein
VRSVPLPNFLVIGAGRSGTTSLHHYLQAHPEVFVPAVKSPSHFYCRDRLQGPDPAMRLVTRNYFVPDRDDYRALFDDVRGERAIGEVSPAYLAAMHPAPRIASELPGVRLVAILRNPVDRAFARFVARSRDGLERRTFREIVDDERRLPLVRDDAAGTYLAAGCVSGFLKAYLDRIPRERIRLYLFEDLQRDARGLLRDLFTFLDVNPAFVPDLEQRHNSSGGLIGNPVLREAWTRTALLRARVRRHIPLRVRDSAFGLVTRNLSAVHLDPEIRRELTALYHDEVEQLASLVGRDLSHWITPLEGHRDVAHPA